MLFGSNYVRLMALKGKYDLKGLFYKRIRWEVRDGKSWKMGGCVRLDVVNFGFKPDTTVQHPLAKVFEKSHQWD